MTKLEGKESPMSKRPLQNLSQAEKEIRRQRKLDKKRSQQLLKELQLQLSQSQLQPRSLRRQQNRHHRRSLRQYLNYLLHRLLRSRPPNSGS
jgi:hypothetical protein